MVSLSDHHANNAEIDGRVQMKYLKIHGLKGYYLNCIQLKKIVKIFSPNVINVHYASGYGTLARISGLSNVILNVWGSDVYDFPYESNIKMKIIKKNLDYANKIASTSKAMAKQVQRLVGKKDIAITPFGVDVALFRNLPSRKSGFTVVVIKTLEKKYGIDTIIKAFAIFKEKIGGMDEEIRLLIYGKGSLMKELEALCEKLGIKKNVLFMGYVENSKIPEIYSMADIACFGSCLNSESFGVSAVEAMACEVPVIATEVDGFLEVIDNNKTGFLVPVGDYKKMADVMWKLYKDPMMRKKMGEEGRKKVLKLYDWEKNVEDMLKLYRKCNK